MGSTDGYVEVCLLPWSDKVEKTKTIKNSANPVWNQTFQFKVGNGKVFPIGHIHICCLRSLEVR